MVRQGGLWWFLRRAPSLLSRTTWATQSRCCFTLCILSVCLLLWFQFLILAHVCLQQESSSVTTLHTCFPLSNTTLNPQGTQPSLVTTRCSCLRSTASFQDGGHGWYSSLLTSHADRVLASSAFSGSGVSLSGKLPLWNKLRSQPSELTAGFYSSNDNTWNGSIRREHQSPASLSLAHKSLLSQIKNIM